MVQNSIRIERQVIRWKCVAWKVVKSLGFRKDDRGSILGTSADPRNYHLSPIRTAFLSVSCYRVGSVLGAFGKAVISSRPSHRGKHKIYVCLFSI